MAGDASTRDLSHCLRQVGWGRRQESSLRMTSREPTPDLTPAMLDAVALLEELEIGYALIGGLAAMVYGRARFTEDVDFVAAPDHEQKLSAAPQAMRRWHFDPSCTWKLCHASGTEIALWKDTHAAQIVARAVAMPLAGRSIFVAEPHDLVAMKLRADRPQDDYDISEVARSRPLDDAVIAERVTPERFARYQAIKKRVGLG
jgi:hypothetical protein